MAKRRVVLKLSGEAFADAELGYGIDPLTVDRTAAEIAAVQAEGYEIAIVVGGGNIFRGLSAAAKDMDRLFEVFQTHNIRYFFYAGGNDSQDTSHKIHEEAIKRGWEMSVIGVPKTIDNDLPHTDSCPGYGSAIKYCATTVREVGMDVASMATDDGACCIIEVMGRSAGWIAAGTVLAKSGNPAYPPHINHIGIHPIALVVPNLDRAVAILKAQGVEFLSEVAPCCSGTGDDETGIVHAIDPDGVFLELVGPIAKRELQPQPESCPPLEIKRRTPLT